jgi:hypothetical protein
MRSYDATRYSPESPPPETECTVCGVMHYVTETCPACEECGHGVPWDEDCPGCDDLNRQSDDA